MREVVALTKALTTESVVSLQYSIRRKTARNFNYR